MSLLQSGPDGLLLLEAALLVAGPLAFVGCYTGLCMCAVKIGAI